MSASLAIFFLALLATGLVVITVRDLRQFSVTGAIDFLPAIMFLTIAILLWIAFYLTLTQPCVPQ